MLAVKLPPEIETRLDILAKRTGRSQGDFALEAILRHIEDIEDVAIAEQRLREPDERLSWDDIKSSL